MTLKIIKALFVFLLIFSLSGCSMLTQYRESEQVILVSGIGFDKKDNTLSVSAETVGTSETKESVIITSFGKTAEECIKNLSKTAGIPLLFSHCGTVVVGQSLDSAEIKETLLYLSTLYDFPLSSYVATSENALSLLKGKSLSGEQTGYAIMKILKENRINSRLFELMRSDNPAIPVFRVQEENYILEDSLWNQE